MTGRGMEWREGRMDGEEAGERGEGGERRARRINADCASLGLMVGGRKRVQQS